jgi:hypothetical protein
MTAHVSHWNILEQWNVEWKQLGLSQSWSGVTERAAERVARENTVEQQHWLDSKMGDMERVIASAAQMEIALPKMNERAHARDQVADYLERVVMPNSWRRAELELANRLRESRQEYQRGVLPNGRRLIRWDRKACLPLLCPDDAREEAMRLSRRVLPRMMELVGHGYTAHYLCATMPNVAAGELTKGMRSLYKRFNSLMRACKRKDRPFPIVGAVAVMEAPMGWRRDWHPHLNIIVVCDGFLDYKALRERWHWNIEMRKLEGNREALARTFRELIKYSCRAVPEKSQSKAAAQVVADETKPPALIEWTAGEFLEWWRAHKRFRRSRTYRLLFGLPKPAKLEQTGVIWIARGWREAFGFRERCPLLESIPGDKSTPEATLNSWKVAMQKILGPPDHLERVLHAAATIKKYYGPVSLAIE